MSTVAEQNVQGQKQPALVSLGTSDQEKADAYRAETLAILKQFCAIRDRAKRDGLVIAFNVADDQYGRASVQHISIVRPL
jgi:hypothetical protein